MKYLSLKAVAVLLALVQVTHGFAEDAPKDRSGLLVNGTFAKGMQGWSSSSSKKTALIGLDDTQKHDGMTSLRIDNPDGQDTNVKQAVVVKPGTRYRMSAFIKTKDALGIKKNDNSGASIAVVGGYQKSKSVAGTKPWSKISFEFDTNRETEIEVCLRLGFYSAAVTGTAWFSDVSLVEVGKARR